MALLPAFDGRVDVVDPSLFTLPYDEALVGALVGAGVDATLVGRRPRRGEAAPAVPFRADWYRRFDGAPRRLGTAGAALKAAEHLLGALRTGLWAGGVSHFQWLPFPLVDVGMLRLCRRRGPVVVTVHDTTPFNGTPTHRLQASGFFAALAAADRLIVHTRAGRQRLAAAGLPAGRIAVVGHGPLGAALARRARPERRQLTLVAFGKIRAYKGLDVLIEALARLGAEARSGLRVVIAGEPMMDLAPLRRRIVEAGLEFDVGLVARRLDEDEMRALLEAADGFVFPYREIEASGVFAQVAGLGRWVIASRLGVFAEAIEDGRSGRLVPPGDVDALAAALAEAALARPVPEAVPLAVAWETIARQTVAVYAEAWRDWHAGRRPVAAAAVAAK